MVFILDKILKLLKCKCIIHKVTDTEYFVRTDDFNFNIRLSINNDKLIFIDLDTGLSFLYDDLGVFV